MNTPDKQLKKLETRAVRAVLHPLLLQSLARLNDSAGVEPDTFLLFLAELASALSKYRKHSKEQRRALRQIAKTPAATDAALLGLLLEKSLYPLPPRPTSPALY